MNSLVAVGVATTTSVVVSCAVAVVLIGPLRHLLVRLCPGPESERFWGRFTILILFVAPLLVTLVFGVPAPDRLPSVSAGEVVRQMLAACLFGVFLALIGIGVRLSTLSGRIPLESVRRERNAS